MSSSSASSSASSSFSEEVNEPSVCCQICGVRVSLLGLVPHLLVCHSTEEVDATVDDWREVYREDDEGDDNDNGDYEDNGAAVLMLLAATAPMNAAPSVRMPSALRPVLLVNMVWLAAARTLHRLTVLLKVEVP